MCEGGGVVCVRERCELWCVKVDSNGSMRTALSIAVRSGRQPQLGFTEV